MDKDLTVEQVNTELRRLAKETPNFIYNPSGNGFCHYTKGHKDGPECNGCIFGQALQNLGVPKTEFPTQQTPIYNLWQNLTGTKPPESWSDVQSAQDKGGTWGEAIKELDS